MSKAESSSLVSDCETRTDPPSEDTEGEASESVDRQNWGRQEKAAYHRLLTLLSYWEQNDFAMVTVELTSSPESAGETELAYNHRRLKQTVERAGMAVARGGESYRLGHIREIEHLVVRTSEGPDGQGVLHLVWAWKPPEGHHSRDFYVPQYWLAHQWGRIHGTGDQLRVWIQRHGSKDYHSRDRLARYFVAQYLSGGQGSALERISYSWQRTMGGSVVETWQALKAVVESVDEAVEVWTRVLGGEEVTLSSGNGVNYDVTVEPPPDLGVEYGEVRIDPPGDYYTQGPDQTTVRTRHRAIPEYDPADHPRRLCPECREFGVVVEDNDHPDERVSYQCDARVPHGGERWCGAAFAAPGDGDGYVVEREFAAVGSGPPPAAAVGRPAMGEDYHSTRIGHDHSK